MRENSPMAPYGEETGGGSRKREEINQTMLNDTLRRFVAGKEEPKLADKDVIGKAIDMMKGLVAELEQNQNDIQDQTRLEHAKDNLKGLQDCWEKILILQQEKKFK